MKAHALYAGKLEDEVPWVTLRLVGRKAGEYALDT
jgi:hypothetical protein